MAQCRKPWLGTALLATLLCANRALAGDNLQTTGFSTCGKSKDIQMQKVDIQYNNDDKTVTFDVAGQSTKQQNVTAVLQITAYGTQVYSNSFHPCEPATFVEQLCPMPEGQFNAKGTQAIPPEFADKIPAIAFQVPDIAAQATLQFKAQDGGEDIVACIQSKVSNGKTIDEPAVSYVAASIAGAALVLSGVTALATTVSGGGGAAGAGSSASSGTGTLSPSFGEVIGWFQTMAMSGMYSVNYPNVYKSFSKNFGFSTGLVPWTPLLRGIDSFRAATGGNLTESSVASLRNEEGDGADQIKRALEMALTLALPPRDITTTVNSTFSGTSSNKNATTTNGLPVTVRGINAYAEQLSVPSADTFMTVLLIVAIIIAAIAVGILLVKVVLEAWALFGSFPKSLTGFRKHYWGSIARTITSLILLLYGVWVLYCIFQFTHGDSWAATVLAGLSLALFTAVLTFFSFKIWSTVRKLEAAEGDATGLYEDKHIWIKYSLFYDAYRKDCWWIFVPTIVYMFVKGAALAVGEGHGLAQTIAQLVIEVCMFVLLLWSRPYERRSGNFMNIAIQMVRVVSVGCILVFVEELGVTQTTSTIAGAVLIAVQSLLTLTLALLIVWNGIIGCCKQNPHRKRRKELEKMYIVNGLTPQEVRNSRLLERTATLATADLGNRQASRTSIAPVSMPAPRSSVGYVAFEPANPYASSQPLWGNAAPLDHWEERQPTLPVFADTGARFTQTPAPVSAQFGAAYRQ